MKLTAVVASCAIASSRCSLLFMQKPPPREKLRLASTRYPECRTGRGIPTLDLLLGGFSGTGAVSRFAQPGGQFGDNASPDERRNIRIAAVAFSVVGLIFVGSALLGYRTASACRDAKDEWYALQPSATTPSILPLQPLPPESSPTLGPAMPGSVGGRCRETAPPCTGDLVCASNLCVRLEAPPVPIPSPAPLEDQ